MENTIYMGEYNFIQTRKTIINMKIKENFKYSSKFSLNYLEDENFDKEYLLFNLKEKNIEIFVNKRKVKDDSMKITLLFDSLNICFFKNDFYLIILNKEEVIEKFYVIKKYFQERQKNLNEISTYEKTLLNDQILFNRVNDNKFLYCLFSNIYFKNRKNKKFSLNYIQGLKIPLSISKINKKNNDIRLVAEIDKNIISDETLKKYLQNFYNLKNAEYKFNYILDIKFQNEKIHKICEEISLNVNESIEIKEKVFIEGEMK